MDGEAEKTAAADPATEKAAARSSHGTGNPSEDDAKSTCFDRLCLYSLPLLCGS